MKALIALAVAVALGITGFIGFIVVDSNRSSEPRDGGLASGLGISIGGGQQSPAAALAGGSVETISRGERVRFADHVQPGVITIFDFTADW